MEDNRLVKIAKTNNPVEKLEDAEKRAGHQRPKRHNRMDDTYMDIHIRKREEEEALFVTILVLFNADSNYNHFLSSDYDYVYLINNGCCKKCKANTKALRCCLSEIKNISIIICLK